MCPNPIIFIDPARYKKLTTREKINRTSKFVIMLYDIDSKLISTREERKRITTIKRYMLEEDLKLMNEKEISLFKHYNFINEAGNIIRD